MNEEKIIYILDTNILLHEPFAFLALQQAAQLHESFSFQALQQATQFQPSITLCLDAKPLHRTLAAKLSSPQRRVSRLCTTAELPPR